MGLSHGAIVTLAVGFFLLAILFPIAMEQVVTANTSLWNASVKTMFTVVLPILVVIGAAIAYIKVGGK